MSDGDSRSTQATQKKLSELLQAEREQGHRSLSSAEKTESDRPPIDLRTLLGEMAALKAAVRAEANASRELRDELRGAVELLQGELERSRQREVSSKREHAERLDDVGRLATLDLIEIADRLEVTIDRARAVTLPRWRWLSWWRDRAATSIADGLELTLRRMRRILETRGARRLDVKGKGFDPETMEAVKVVERPDVDEGTVVEEVTAGYVAGRGSEGQRTLRTAQVVVSRKSKESA